MEKKSQAFLRLLDIMDDLREKCPWDKKQTMDTLSYLTIEETYELVDAISDKNLHEIKGELGDLLLHIVFIPRLQVKLTILTLQMLFTQFAISW